jgi:D-glycero-D-manno-heptose 1,7-bisphosphate phosphatase
MHKILFLDRDGVINVEKNYVHKIQDFRLIDSFVEGVMPFVKNGFSIIIITNQSGIGRGYYSLSQYKNLEEHIFKIMKNLKIPILGIYYCPHLPSDNCMCRKPKPGMIEKACSDYNVDKSTSILVGDKLSDVVCGKNSGIKNNFLVRTGHPIKEDLTDGVLIFNDLIELSKYIYE